MPDRINSSLWPHSTASRRPNLLIVDDHPVIIHLLYQIFAADHQIFMATSGEQALAICRENPPDLVLLDVEMPNMNGPDVCRQLKADPGLRDLPVIFVTGHNDSDAESMCWDAGGVDFIAKPINPKTVRSRVRAHLTLKFQADLLRQMVFVDGLTGVANRRYFDERLGMEWKRSHRGGTALALAMIDIDFFKRYNDALGHQAGDFCIQQVAACIKNQLNRPYDLAARYGGEEFACILPEIDEAGALTVGRSIEAAVRALQIPHPASEVGPVVTVSIGVAFGSVDLSAEGLLAKADEYLYNAKRTGRGRVWPA